MERRVLLFGVGVSLLVAGGLAVWFLPSDVTQRIACIQGEDGACFLTGQAVPSPFHAYGASMLVAGLLLLAYNSLRKED